MADGCLDGAGDCREVVQAFLNQEPNDAIRIEDEVGTSRVLVANDAVDALVVFSLCG